MSKAPGYKVCSDTKLTARAGSTLGQVDQIDAQKQLFGNVNGKIQSAVVKLKNIQLIAQTSKDLVVTFCRNYIFAFAYCISISADTLLV